MTGFIKLFDTFHNMCHDIAFMWKHRTRPSCFTRKNAKISFANLLSYILRLPKASSQAEVNNFLQMINSDDTYTKQSMWDARLKLSHTAFIELSDALADEIYSSGDYKTILGFRPTAVDGSVLDLPSSAALSFGTQKTAGNDAAKARAVILVDIANDIILKSDITPYRIGEGATADRLIAQHLKKRRYNDLFIFDRGFFSLKFARKLHYQNAFFLFRVSGSCANVIRRSNEPDQIIYIDDGLGNDMPLRVVNIVLSTGETEKLVTNVLDSTLKVTDFGMLYQKRWGVEVKYLELKERLQIENFTSGNKQFILQDFFATVLVSNLVSVARQEIQAEADAKAVGKNRKHEYVINRNLAFATLRDAFVKALSEYNDLDLRDRLVQKALRMVEKYVVPLRPNRPSTPRTPKNKSARFPLNKKRSW